MTGIVVCGGSIDDYQYLKKYFQGAGLVICADSGAFHLRSFDITPDILLGDFDSISPDDYNFLSAAGVEVLKFPVEKDMTDSELAVTLAAERGCNRVVLLGATGTRLDHTLSNVYLLKKLLELGVEGVIADEHNEARLIDDRISLRKEKGMKVTLLPVSEKVFGVTTKGLYYPLRDATLVLGSSLGVSNEFSEEAAEISLAKGLLLVINARD